MATELNAFLTYPSFDQAGMRDVIGQFRAFLAQHPLYDEVSWNIASNDWQFKIGSGRLFKTRYSSSCYYVDMYNMAGTSVIKTVFYAYASSAFGPIPVRMIYNGDTTVLWREPNSYPVGFTKDEYGSIWVLFPANRYCTCYSPTSDNVFDISTFNATKDFRTGNFEIVTFPAFPIYDTTARKIVESPILKNLYWTVSQERDSSPAFLRYENNRFRFGSNSLLIVP